MRVADYIFKTLADKGVEHCFLVTGGGAMQLNDALRLETRITPVCCHHEQACAIAAEGYFRASGRLPVVSVTTGPGGTNAITGVIGAWLDSIPMIVISGQVKFCTTIASCLELGLRQLGDQEINIIDLVKPITKFAKMVTDPGMIKVEMETAMRAAVSGRPGPVWLDIPLDVQGALIDERNLREGHAEGGDHLELRAEANAGNLAEFRKMLSVAKRPVIIAGHGIELDHAEGAFAALAEAKVIPVLTTFNGMNVLPTSHPLNFGRIGTIGQRAANFILQSADLMISIGSRNNIRQVSYNWENFARRAKKVVVDIDARELVKPTVRPDLPICMSAAAFISSWGSDIADGRRPEWLKWCEERRNAYPAHTPEQMRCENGVDPYHFFHVLTSRCPEDSNVVAGNGTACVALFQTAIAKPGQKIFWNSGCASMGYDIPAALGAAVATNRLTICIAGDGSAMMNIQELATILYHRLPVKIFLLDNDGYSSIRQTQTNLFSPDLIGCGIGSGVGIPDFMKLASGFGYQVAEIRNHDEIEEVVDSQLAVPGPTFCVVRIPASITFAPKLSARRLPDGTMSSPSLEDMYPFLESEELARNRISDD